MSKNQKIIWTICLCIITVAIATRTFLPSSSRGSVKATRLLAEPYFHSYEEMQIWAGVEPDGFWGPISDMAYRAKRDRVYNDKMAVLTWPELEN